MSNTHRYVGFDGLFLGKSQSIQITNYIKKILESNLVRIAGICRRGTGTWVIIIGTIFLNVFINRQLLQNSGKWCLVTCNFWIEFKYYCWVLE
jgi:hypothetical protein